MKPWKTLHTHLLLDRRPWLSVLEDTVRLPSGRVQKGFYRIPMPSFSATAAFTKDGKILILRHYKHGAGKVIYGLPAGHIEEGESPLAAAKRELLEETGYGAPRWKSLGSFICNANRGGGTAHFFLARGAVKKTQPVIDDMEECRVLRLPPQKAAGLLRRRGALSLAGAAALALALGPARRAG